jgi:hypothetical protein
MDRGKNVEAVPVNMHVYFVFRHISLHENINYFSSL